MGALNRSIIFTLSSFIKYVIFEIKYEKIFVDRF